MWSAFVRRGVVPTQAKTSPPLLQPLALCSSEIQSTWAPPGGRRYQVMPTSWMISPFWWWPEALTELLAVAARKSSRSAKSLDPTVFRGKPDFWSSFLCCSFWCLEMFLKPSLIQCSLRPGCRESFFSPLFLLCSNGWGWCCNTGSLFWGFMWAQT